VSKSSSTLNAPPPNRPAAIKIEQWEEARSVFPIYVAMAKQLQVEVPLAQAKRTLPEKPDAALYRNTIDWFDAMDQRVLVHQLRHLLQMTTLNASESGLRVLIQRHLRKPSKTSADRDKIDFLLVQYFALCAPPKIYHKQIELEDAAQVMQPVLGEIDTAPLDWCEPLETMILALRGFRSLRDMLKTNFIAQGRKVKEAAGGMFYDPSAMLAFIRFNFLMRRTLIELMHADLIAIRTGLEHLETEGVRIIDCRPFGLSNSESLSKIKQLAEEWKQPFQQEYTERSVNETFEKLLNLRTAVEQALEHLAKMQAPIPSPPPGARAAVPTSKAPREPRAAEVGKDEPPAKPPAKTRASAPAPKAEAASTIDFDACLEQIWEQLIATPPTRGRSMTTVKMGKARILMSSWEVTAFVSEDGPAAEDLRRAVVARAIITAALEEAKESGNATRLEEALVVARAEIARLQERVDIAKRAKDTEAAVNLGISTKRLLSAVDEAEKL
jgi:hypothetical protein